MGMIMEPRSPLSRQQPSVSTAKMHIVSTRQDGDVIPIQRLSWPSLHSPAQTRFQNQRSARRSKQIWWACLGDSSFARTARQVQNLYNIQRPAQMATFTTTIHQTARVSALLIQVTTLARHGVWSRKVMADVSCRTTGRGQAGISTRTATLTRRS